MPDVQIQPLTLESLLADLERGRFAVPNFQRDVEWDKRDIRELMRSIFSDFFIGTLVLWGGGGDWEALLECEPISGFKERPTETPGPDVENGQARSGTGSSAIVLDGQQRLTAMYYAFFGHSDPSSDDSGLGREWFFIDLEKFEGTNEVDPERSSAFSSRSETQADAKWFAELAEYDPILTDRPDGDPFPYAETQGHSFPLRLLGAGHAERWLQKYMDFWTAKARKHNSQAAYHKSQSEELLARAAEMDGGPKPTFQPPMYDSSYQALKQKAQDADDAVTECQAEIESLREKSRALRQELRTSTHTGRNVGTGQEHARVLKQIRRRRQDLQALKKEAADAQAAVRAIRQELDRAADAGQRSPDTTAGKNSVAGLIHSAEAEEQSTRNHEERAREAAQSVRFGESFRHRVQNLRGKFTVPAFRIDGTMHQNVVSEMFSQLNRRGKSLKAADLVNAYVALHEFNLKKAAREFEAHLSEQGLASGRAREDVLRIMLIDVHPQSAFELTDENYECLFPGRSTSTRDGKSEVLIKNGADFANRYREAQEAYERGLIALRRESYYGKPLTDTSGPSAFVPFGGILPVYCSLLALATEGDELQRRVRQWYWASVLTERYYSSSQESSNAERGSLDYNQVLAWVDDDTKKPLAIRHLEDRFGPSLFPRDRLLVKSPGVTRPGLVDGILGLLFMLRPRGWSTGEQYESEDVTEADIVSPRWCREQGLPEALTQSVFNQVLVDKETADAMQEQSPRQYLEAILADLPPGEKDDVLRSHCISRAGYELLMSASFSRSEFEAFLQEREAEFLRCLAQDLFGELKLNAP